MPITTVRKKYGYTTSAIQGNNKIAACARAEWGNIRDNSLILIDGDQIFYQIINKRKFTYKKSVTVLNSNQLKIGENIGTTLGADDDLSFRHQESEIISADINDGGSGYVVGDVLKPEGGICKYNSLDEIDIPAQCKVAEVNDSGEILSIELINGGVYNVSPENSCNALSGTGDGATLSITSSLFDTLSIEQRSITLVELLQNETIIHLNSPLPPKVKNGEIEVDKWELTLNRDYLGDSKFNVGYDVIKDFTPNANLPLLHGDILSSYLLYNEAMIKIDEKIKSIEDQLGSIEDQLGP